MRAIWPELKAYFRRDFHPWQVDDRDLIEQAVPQFVDHLAPRATG